MEQNTQNIDFDNDDNLPNEEDLEEIDIVDTGGQNEDDDEFDLIIFKLQEILISEEFEDMQEKFMDSHCDMFNDGDECGHDQYIAFTEFKKKIEKHIEDEMKEVLPEFTQKRFQELTKDRAGELDELIVDTLVAFDDFMKFKERMLEHKITKWSREGRKDELLEDFSKQEYLDILKNADIKGLEAAITVSNLVKEQVQLIQQGISSIKIT